MPLVKVLPFDKKIGFAQKAMVKIKNQVYRLFYSWNANGFVTLRIRDLDGRIVFNGKLAEKNAYEVKDPATHEVLFTILAWKVEKEEVEVWVFE
ncbi:MAG: hypothetical protein QXV61_00200 [Archaeoglobaceae archaeon]